MTDSFNEPYKGTMFTHNGKISNRQVVILLILQMFNTNILVVPRIGTYYIGRNAYILPIIAILIGCLYSWCITEFTMKFSGKTLVEILEEIVPSPIRYIILGVFLIKLLVGTGLELRMIGEIVLKMMLPRTPLPVIILMILLVSAYLVKSGIEALGRMGEVLVYFVFIPISLMLIIVCFNMNYSEVLPLFRLNIEDTLMGSMRVSYIFIPLEFMLMMTGLMRTPNKARRSGIIAVIIIGIVSSIFILFTICKIGVTESQRQLWPVLTFLQSIGLKNSIIENQELLMINIWILTIYIYISSGIYFSSLTLSRSFKFKRENIFVLPLLPIVLVIALFPANLIQTYEYYFKFQYYTGIWFVLIIPILLIFFSKIRGYKYEG